MTTIGTAREYTTAPAWIDMAKLQAGKEIGLLPGTYAIIAVDTDTMGIEFITVADAGEVVEAIATDHMCRMNDLENGDDPMCVDEYRIFFASGTAFNGSAIALVTP